MRLRLAIHRNQLPATRIWWDTASSFQPADDHTVSALLARISQVVPLDGASWGLEDYVVEVDGFEVLHFQLLDAILKENDEVVIRPLTTAETKARRLAGRRQISANGKKLIDGTPFGRTFTRPAPDRPELMIPPRKRARSGNEKTDSSTLRLSGASEESDDDNDVDEATLCLLGAPDKGDDDNDVETVWGRGEARPDATPSTSSERTVRFLGEIAGRDSDDSEDEDEDYVDMEEEFSEDEIDDASGIANERSHSISEKAAEKIIIDLLKSMRNKAHGDADSEPSEVETEPSTNNGASKSSDGDDSSNRTPKGLGKDGNKEALSTKLVKNQKVVADSGGDRKALSKKPVKSRKVIADSDSASESSEAESTSSKSDSTSSKSESTSSKSDSTSSKSESTSSKSESEDSDSGSTSSGSESESEGSSSPSSSSYSSSSSSHSSSDSGSDSESQSSEEEAVTKKAPRKSAKRAPSPQRPSKASRVPHAGLKATIARNHRKKVSKALLKLQEKGHLPKDLKSLAFKDWLAQNGLTVEIGWEELMARTSPMTTMAVTNGEEGATTQDVVMEDARPEPVQTMTNNITESTAPDVSLSQNMKDARRSFYRMKRRGKLQAGCTFETWLEKRSQQNQSIDSNSEGSRPDEISSKQPTPQLPISNEDSSKNPTPPSDKDSSKQLTPRRLPINDQDQTQRAQWSTAYGLGNKKWRRMRDKMPARVAWDENGNAIEDRITAAEDTHMQMEKPKDPNFWRQKIILRAVECVDKSIGELPTPDFPFDQRQLQPPKGTKRKRRKNANGGQKNNQQSYQDDYSYNDEQYMADWNLNNYYDDTTQAPKEQAPAQEAVEDLPSLPDDMASLYPLIQPILPKTVVAFKHLTMDERYRPILSDYRTAIVDAVHDEPNGPSLELTLAVRDRPKRDFNPDTGEKILKRFELADDEDKDEGYLNLMWGELIEPKVVQLPNILGGETGSGQQEDDPGQKEEGPGQQGDDSGEDDPGQQEDRSGQQENGLNDKQPEIREKDNHSVSTQPITKAQGVQNAGPELNGAEVITFGAVDDAPKQPAQNSSVEPVRDHADEPIREDAIEEPRQPDMVMDDAMPDVENPSSPSEPAPESGRVANYPPLLVEESTLVDPPFFDESDDDPEPHNLPSPPRNAEDDGPSLSKLFTSPEPQHSSPDAAARPPAAADQRSPSYQSLRQLSHPRTPDPQARNKETPSFETAIEGNASPLRQASPIAYEPEITEPLARVPTPSPQPASTRDSFSPLPMPPSTAPAALTTTMASSRFIKESTVRSTRSFFDDEYSTDSDELPTLQTILSQPARLKAEPVDDNKETSLPPLPPFSPFSVEEQLQTKASQSDRRSGSGSGHRVSAGVAAATRKAARDELHQKQPKRPKIQIIDLTTSSSPSRGDDDDAGAFGAMSDGEMQTRTVSTRGRGRGKWKAVGRKKN